MPLSAEAENKIKSVLDSTVDHGIPGLLFCAIDKSGEFLTKQTSGCIGAETNTPIGLDQTLWLASCTKIITSIACMQLVEQGKLDLDSSEHLYQVLPELRSKKVINDNGGFDERQGEITLRMLLTHTSGFAYSFTHPKALTSCTQPTHEGGYFDYELVYQPGTRWLYGVGIEWIGAAIELISGLNIDEYFRKYIFEPLGIENMAIVPSETMKNQLIKLSLRDQNSFREIPHLYGNYLNATEEEKPKLFLTAGSGLFGSLPQFSVLLATLLNDGVSPNTGAKLLEKKTVDEMFTNHIQQLPNFGYEGFVSTVPYASNSVSNMYPQEGNPPQGHGLSFCLTLEPGATGRGPSTGWWAGLANIYYWVDRSRGVAGVIGAQVLPFWDADILAAWHACEKAVYDGLQ